VPLRRMSSAVQLSGQAAPRDTHHAESGDAWKHSYARREVGAFHRLAALHELNSAGRMARRVAFHAGFSQPESPGNFEKVEGHVNCDGSRDYVANCGQQIAKGPARGGGMRMAITAPEIGDV
jgi:hypothetical protein